MIGLIDYGMGNIHSVTKALEHVGGRVQHVATAADLTECSRIVFPGVGAFRDCMATLKARQMDAALLCAVGDGLPVLGICLGMQAMMGLSHEFGRFEGLGLIDGEVVPFPSHLPAAGHKVPHMGWNDAVLTEPPHPVLAAIGERQLYFVHSYYCQPKDRAHTLAVTEHGGVRFAAAIGRDNLLGVQFHPEKSQQAGLDMLAAFRHWTP
ncbi:MAG: imidazole glycerol phosphate synthase subunit HisH [Mariprofundales bacterium]